MALEEKEIVWLKIFTGITAVQDDAALTEVLEDDSLSVDSKFRIVRAAEELEAAKIRQAFIDQTRVKVENKMADLEKLNMEIETKQGDIIKTLGRDQTETFDYENDKELVTLTKEQEAAFSKASIDLLAIVDPLEQKMFTWSRIDGESIVRDNEQPLFTKDQLAREIYTPLVKELVLPESIVPDEYSEVHKMITETNDYYIQELEEVSEWQAAEDHISFAQEMVSGTASLMLDGLELGMDDSESSQEKLEMIKAATGLAESAVNGGMDAALAIAQKDPQKAIQGFVLGVADSLGETVGTATGNEALGAYISHSLNAAMKIPDLASNIKEGDPASFIENMVDMVATGLDIGGEAVVDGKDDDEVAEAKKELLEKIKTGITEGFAIALKGYRDGIVTAIANGDWGAIRVILTDAALSAGSVAFDEKVDIIDGESGVIDVDGPRAATKKEAKAQNKALKGLAGGGFDLLKDINADSLPKAEEYKQKAEEDKKAVYLNNAERMEAELASEKEEFLGALETLGQKEQLDKNELKSISKMMEQMKKDAAMMAQVNTLASGGVAVISKFIKPLAIAGTAMAFMKSLGAAVERAQAMRKWMESSDEALNAVSPYYSSIQNFVKNQKEQFAHETIKSALLMLQVAAQVTAAAGTGTPVQAIAEIVDTGLNMALSLEELTYSVYQKVQVEQAWALTKDALDHPENRKLNLKVRKLNPTLAKYSIAFGAIVQKDLIAIDALNRIGLDRETLAQKDAKVGSVKSFLEAKYKDDNKILRKYKPKKGILGKLPEVDLTIRSWKSAHILMEKEGDVKPDNTRRIVLALKAVMEGKEKVDKYADDLALMNVKECDEYILALEEASAAFDAYRPLHPNDKPNDVMKKEVVSTFGKMVQTERRIAMVTRMEKEQFDKENPQEG